ncbi:tRNA (guanine(37)-N(1))-methyltransferase [Rhipicephalus microplus]
MFLISPLLKWTKVIRFRKGLFPSLHSIIGKTVSGSHKQRLMQRPCPLLTTTMATAQNLSRAIQPPAGVLGMVELNRAAFDTTVSVPSFEVDAKDIADVMTHMRKYLLKLPKFKAVQENGTRKRFHLDPAKVSTFNEIDLASQAALSQAGVSVLGERQVSLTYDNWTSEDILRAVIGQPDASGYSLIGHVLHLNLREHLQPYKKLIGQVYLDKVKNVRCVVSKVNIIENTFRNFCMELLAGERDTRVQVKQNGARFEFDFANVYWNPRLSTEHSRVIDLLHHGDVLYDVFAGVGPFVIPAARKGCTVFANDLNPHSYAWLNHNVTLNNVSDRVSTYNMDGREFIQKVIGESLVQHLADNRHVHVCMNLPALATEFLDTFVGLLSGSEHLNELVKNCYVKVHCYCFVKGEEGVTGAKRKVEEGLGQPLERDVQVSFVRNVAPNKDMMRASFDLALKILSDCSPAKRCKMERTQVTLVGSK